MPTYNGTISWKVRDTKGLERVFYQHAEMTIVAAADFESAVQAITAALDAPLSGRIVDCWATIKINVSGQVKASPEPGSFVGDGATISFKDSEDNSNPIWIPTIDEDKYLPKGILNTDDVEIAALLTRFFPGENVVNTTNIDFTDEDNRKFEVVSPSQKVIKAIRTTRKFRGGG